MRIVVSGASGLIGSALVAAARAEGHDVLKLVRRVPSAADEVRWDPGTGQIDVRSLAGVDAAVHMAGAGVGDRRWTPAYKAKIRDSRVQGTRTLATALTTLEPLPRVLVSGSAIGFYGDTGDRTADETTPSGDTFLAGVVRDWEAATEPAERAGIRVVHARTGLVVARKGGAFGRLLPLIRLGVGGPIGSGQQWWSWITLADEVRALLFLLSEDALSGPVNVTGPHPDRNGDIIDAIARAFHRRALVKVPHAALRIGLGEFADELVVDQRAVPTRLSEAGFRFDHPDLASAVRTLT